MLVVAYSCVGIEPSNRRCLAFDLTNSLRLVVAQWLSEAVVVVERNDGLWEMVEVPTEDVGCIVDCIACPVQTLAVARWGVERDLQLLDPLL